MLGKQNIGGRYELSNHLGNVLATISDYKSAVNSGVGLHYEAVVLTAQDYDPFGMVMNHRKYNTQNSKQGFNGQERDFEINADGNINTAMFWEYDARLGRRWNVDPVTYPWQSTYSTNNDNPIWYQDPLGLFGSKKEAKNYKNANDIKGKISKEKNSEDWIITNKKQMTYYKGVKEGDEIGRSINLGDGKEDGVESGVLIFPERHIKPEVTNDNDYLIKKHLDDLTFGKSVANNINYWANKNSNQNFDQIANQESKRGGHYKSKMGGPIERWVLDPLHQDEGIVIDMKHFLAAIHSQRWMGNLNESQQASNDNRSANNPQDYYSNNLGYAFHTYYIEEVNAYIYGPTTRTTTDLAIYIKTFLSSEQLRVEYLNRVK